MPSEVAASVSPAAEASGAQSLRNPVIHEGIGVSRL